MTGPSQAVLRSGTLPELQALESVLARGGPALQCEVACHADHAGQRLPVYAVTLGNPDPSLPAAGFFGGVHGLERIGSHVVIAFLEHLVARLAWDATLHQQLEQVRLLFMPVVNPGGMARGTRANPAGVDLMRNAPVDAHEPVPFLLAGQRISAVLPWYRGPAGAPMQPESAALCAWAERELLGRPFALALDCHSGFGMRDRIWFPFAHRRSRSRACRSCTRCMRSSRRATCSIPMSSSRRARSTSRTATSGTTWSCRARAGWACSCR